MINSPIRVGCVEQEYWYMRRQKCVCGGTFERQQQQYLDGPAGALDIIEAACLTCGQRRSFVFDISSFMGAARSIEKGELFQKYCTGMPEQKAIRAVDAAFTSPMATTVMYLMKLAETKDTLALDYITEAIEYAKKLAFDARP